jgi:hypothetical protein
MQGIIKIWDVIAHPLLIIQTFGVGFLWRAILADRDQTFLGLVEKQGASAIPSAATPDVVERCIDLELCAQGIYESLARRFPDRHDVAAFFRGLAEQEHEHAEALDLCRTLAQRDGWHEELLALWRDIIPTLESRMHAARARSDDIRDVRDALSHVIDIESSEINRAYLAIISASRSPFMQKFEAFTRASSRHIDYIVKTIPAIDPTLREACRALSFSFQGSRGSPKGFS